MALFTAAVDTLQRVFGELVTYAPAAGGSSEIYAVYRNPTEEDFIGGSSVITEVTVFEIALSDIALPVKNDLITRADSSVFRIRVTPTLDEARTTWLLDVIEVLGGSPADGSTRITPNGDRRITPSGDVRIIGTGS